MIEGIRQGDIPGVQLRCRLALQLAPPAAWAWLTEPELLARWLAPEVQAEPAPGGHLVLGGAAVADASFHERGETLEVSAPRRWVLSFRRLDAGWAAATTLTLEVLPRPDGCELSVLQEGFQRLALSECLTAWETYRRRWRAALARLEAAVRERQGAST